MSPRNVTGKYVVKNCGEEYTEWNFNTSGGGDFCTNLSNKPSP
jgi:hypothetical protein